MGYLDFTREEFSKCFVDNLLVTNRGFNYFVDWSNVPSKSDLDIELYAMDSLIGEKNFDEKFKLLLKKLPTVVATFPYLLAFPKIDRNNLLKGKFELEVVNSEMKESYGENNLKYKFSLKELEKGLSDKEICDYLFFFKAMGLKELFCNKIQKSTKDYVTGALVGLDTHGRKNRGGDAFELACTPIIKEVCKKYKIEVFEQQKFKILNNYGFTIPKDIRERKADFILLKNNKALSIEVNFFNGGGSKPEEIIDSYINRQRELNNIGIDFVLITDGVNCWGKEGKSQLVKAFNNLDYFMNYNLAKHGMLEEVILKVF